MLKSKKNWFTLLVLLFIVTLKLNGMALAQGGCVGVPTITGNPEFQVDWSTFQWHPDNLEVVEQNESITVSVLNGKPSFTWQISGNDFWFDPIYTVTSIQNGGSSATIYAGPNACGSATITVTDTNNEIVTGSVRNTSGYWAFKGNYCGLSGSVTCSSVDRNDVAKYTLISGNKKQYQETRLIRDHKIHPEQGHCQYCDDYYASYPCGSDSETSDEPNCIDGDHQVPGYDCCSTNYYWCKYADGCRSDFAPDPEWGSTGECVPGDYRWMAHVEVSCVNKSEGVTRLLYYEWECS